MRHKSLSDLVANLEGYQILATSCSASSRPFRTYDFTQPTAVIMGNEHSGVAAELANIATGELYIPMFGMIQSFNVSVAAALILAEACRQREDAGLYATPRYSADELAQKLDAWLQM